MASLNALKDTLNFLDLSRSRNVPITISVTGTIRKLIQVLVEEKIVEATNINHQQTRLTVNNEIIKFEAIPEVLTVSRKEVLRYAADIVPSITGHMLMTTSKGIMTHHDAVQKGVGGQIIGYVY